MNTNISKPHNLLKRKLKTNSVHTPKVLRIDSRESQSETTDFKNDLALVSESKEIELEDQVNHLVSMIKDTLENKNKELTSIQKNQLNEYLKYLKNAGEELTSNDIDSVRNYTDFVLRKIQKHEKFQETTFTESKLQTMNEAEDLITFINNILKNRDKQLSAIQKQQLKGYLKHIQKVKVRNITPNELISIQNHIRSAIYKEKEEIDHKINDMIFLYSHNDGKLKILETLKKELGLLTDKYLCKADSVYFTEQLKLLHSGNYILRENLLALIDDKFLEQKIGTYPDDSYIKQVNKLKTKIRRKPFVLPATYKTKVMNKLNKITRGYRLIPYFY